MAVQTVMTPERTETLLNAYLKDLLEGGDFARYFADDVVVTLMWSDLVAKGRVAAEKLIVNMHREAFRARPRVKNLVVGAGKALLEADFIATHIAEFAGKAASGKEVFMPYCAVYDLQDDRITALRLYFPMEALLRQLDA